MRLVLRAFSKAFLSDFRPCCVLLSSCWNVALPFPSSILLTQEDVTSCTAFLKEWEAGSIMEVRADKRSRCKDESKHLLQQLWAYEHQTENWRTLGKAFVVQWTSNGRCC